MARLHHLPHRSARPSCGSVHIRFSKHNFNSRHSLSSRLRCKAGNASLELFSPSKVNLFLRIIRKRPDGYHDLASLFQVIDAGDEMSFQLCDGREDKLKCSMCDVPTDKSNLVIKALDLFRRKTGLNFSMKIDLRKKVPMGAGLGGGSANAATTLWAANELQGRPASSADLLKWSGEIGSDISVFFSQGTAYCTGRGEIVEDVDVGLPLETPILLVKHAVGCSTPQIFKAMNLAECSQADPRELLDGLASDFSALPGLCVNDLEEPAFKTLPVLRELKTRLIEETGGRFSSVFMTGSGSTIVCIGDDSPPAFLAEAKYGEMFVQPARFIRRRPDEWYTSSCVQALPVR